MPSADPSLQERLNKLGLECGDVPTDRLTSATTALCCFPMYMVSNVHAWTHETQWSIPLTDIPGFEAIREAFAIGRQEKHLDITPEHRRLLGTLLGRAKPSDLVIYEYALDALALFLEQSTPEIAERVRNAVATMIVAVAKASGEGLLGTGEKINRHEHKLIRHIADLLGLRESAEAKATLDAIEA